jgi:glycosyltransferase 2 family protein
VTKKNLIGLVLVVCIFLLLLYRVDLQQLGTSLVEVHIGFLAGGIIAQLIIIWLKSIRWAIAIRGATGRSVYGALSASIIGFAGNVLLPARLGELLRIRVIDKHNQIGWSVALTTVGLTQLFDLLILLGYFLLVSIWATSLLATHRWEIGLLTIVIMLMLGSLLVLQQKASLIHAVFLPIHQRLPDAIKRHLTRHTELFVQGLSVLGNGPLLRGILLLTITVWGLETASTYLMLQAFDIKPTLLMTAMLVVVLNLSGVVPITPGNIGITQAVSVFLLGTFGVIPAAALAYSIGAQGAIQLLIVCLGMICLYREGMSLNLFRYRSREEIGVPTSTIEVQR